MLVAAMASLQLGASFAERLFPVVGAAGAAALRLLGSSLILAVVRRPWRGFDRRRPWRALVAYGVVLGAMNSLFYAALRTLPLGIAVAIEFLGPLAVATLASRRALDLVWVALALAGLWLLLPLGGAADRASLVGVAYALGAGVCWALYIVFGRRAGEAHGADATGLGIFIATAIFLPPQVAAQGLHLFTPTILPIALAVAVLSSALPYSLEMYALTRLPTRTFGTLMSLEPAVGALAGLLLMNQRLAGLQWAGVLAVVLASFGAALSGDPVTAPEGP